MKRIALSVLAVLTVLTVATVAAAESREATKARLSAISAQCTERTNEYYFGEEARRASDCLRIGSLRNDLIRCAHEREHLRRAAGCSHQWQDTGPGRRWCRECRSIADFLGGEWQVVFTGGLFVGPDPMRYPKEYGLK
jgi:hypothetical protein